MKIRFYSLFFLFFIFSSFAEILPLKGYRLDYLVDFDKGKVIYGRDSFDFNKKVSAGYFFVWGKSLFLYNSGKLSVVGKDINFLHQFKGVVLPELKFLHRSIQFFLRENFLFLPVSEGFVVYDVEKNREIGEIKCDFDRGDQDILFPEIFVKGEYIFLVFNKRVDIYKEFKKIKTFKIDNSLFFKFSPGKDFFSFLIVEKPGGVFSIKTVLKAYHYNFSLINKKEMDVFPKNIFEVNGDFIFEKKEISIFSLFGSKKIHFVKTDLRKGKIKELSFSLSHKRRHLFPVYSKNKVYIVAQCKDGKVFLLDLYRKKKTKLEQKVYYDYSFLKGEEGGVFYEKNGSNYFAVKFKFSFLSRLF